jgi:membrane associated rhomboid family serine protease
MDWSLVLASQGIEAVIADPQDGLGWGLLVAQSDCARALQALRQYRIENRHWPWRQSLPWPELRFDWGSLAWAAVLVLFHSLAVRYNGLEAAGAMDSSAVFSGQQWWRIFTAMTLHADIAHLATNLSLGIVLLGLAMGRYGTGTGLLAAWLAGAAGNIASLFFNVKPFVGLGASGMVMGGLGLLAASSLLPGEHRSRSRKHFLIGLAAGTMLFILYGLAPGTDLAAHFGGFVAGVLLGTLLTSLPGPYIHKSLVNFTCGLLVAAMVAITWWIALKAAHIK